MKLAIHWFRRDLRLNDNTALSHAVNEAEVVIPVFILEEALREGPDVGAGRLAFLLRSVESLRDDLSVLGYPLVVRHGRSEIEIPKLCRELRAEAVFCNRRYEPYAQARDGRIFRALQEQGVGFHCFKDAVIREDRDLLTQAGQPYTVFTPYAKAWRKKEIPMPRSALRAKSGRIPKIRSERVPTDPSSFGHPLSHQIPVAGEKAAAAALKLFIKRKVARYHLDRDFPAQDGTSHLSAHLRCGTIGIRTILGQLRGFRNSATAGGRKGAETFENELIWREFYMQILSNFPHVMRGSFRPLYDRLAWRYSDKDFEAWCVGRTGYPIVDAAMRCLNATGWMHNRLRMIVAMFLTKDLLLNWQWGERYFMKTLMDGDMAANNGGWQWSAGTGTDAAPYFRIFNPVSQGKKFDPNGAFIRQWIPDLAALADEIIHEPWKRSPRIKGYFDRIVIHEQQRPKCLAMYKKVLNLKR